MVWHTKFSTKGTNFILVKSVERLNQLELHVFWKSTHVVVRLDGLSSICTRLNHVCVKCSLCQEFHIFELACFVIKDIDKFVTDDLPFLLWIRHTSQFIKETFGSVCFNDIETKLTTKHVHNLVSFPFTKKTVVYKDTDQLITDSFLEKNPYN